MADQSRQPVVRADGRTISVVQRRAHLSYCFTGCCCGKTERGYPTCDVQEARAVPTYLATGARTPLAHGLKLASGLINEDTAVVQQADRMHGTHIALDALDEVRLVDLVQPMAERATAQP